MIRVCPARDTVCPHGMDCLYVGDGYECGDPTIRAEAEYRKHIDRVNRTTDREIEENERRLAASPPPSQNDAACSPFAAPASPNRDAGQDALVPQTCPPPPSQEGLEAWHKDQARIASAKFWPEHALKHEQTAAALSRLRAELEDEQESCKRHYDMLQRVRTRAAAAEATVTRLTEALTKINQQLPSPWISTVIDAALRTEPHNGK